MRRLGRIDFGATATSLAEVVVNEPSVKADTIVSAWLHPRATADHTVEEHLLAPIRIVAGPCTAGVGFTVYAICGADPSAKGKQPGATGQWFFAFDTGSTS